MCDICHQIPCHSRCPNAKEDMATAFCTVCDEPVYSEDLAYEFDGDLVCDNCLSDYCRKYYRWRG